jgi:sulfofructose kinase
METCEVLGLGVCTLDILCHVDHFPAGDEVQRAATLSLQGGGPVATAMATVARLGVRTAMLDSLGDDWRAALIRDEFLRLGVGIDLIRTHHGCTSSTACVLVRQSDGARAIIYSPGDAPELEEKDLPLDVIRSLKFLHLNGRHWSACKAAAQLAKSCGVRVSFDGGAQRFRPELRALIPLCDVCIVAQDFAKKYTGLEDVEGAAHAMLREGPTLVVVTAGLDGSWIFPYDAPSFHQPAFSMPAVVDTTGCGDSYHGAFLFGLLRGYTLSETAALASAVAALNSQALGGRAALPTLPQVVAFLHERQAL